MILLIDNYDSFTSEPLPVFFASWGQRWLSAVTMRSRWMTLTRWHLRKS